MKRYEFTGETKKIDSSKEITVRRIRAIAEFREVKIGELGGWIETEENLKQMGNAWVYGDAWVYGNARVCENAQVYGDARVCGDAWVYGNARVCENAQIYGNARVCGDARIICENQLLTIGPIGSRNDFTTFFRDRNNEITVRCGCFVGKIDDFINKVKKTHGDGRHAMVYSAAAEIAKMQIDLAD